MPAPAPRQAGNTFYFTRLDGDPAQGPLDRALRLANRFAPHPNADEVGGVPCLGLDAKTGEVESSYWLDPRHGYRLARVLTTYPYTRNFHGQILRGHTTRERRENVRFELIAGVWLPMEWDEFQEVQGPSYALTNHTHLKCSFSADPDHQALGSFRPASFVTNGTRVAFAGEPRNQPVVRVWQDGHILTRQASKESPDTGHGKQR